MAANIDPLENEKRLELYGNRLSDGQIGRECGVDKASIRIWRKRRKLPPNYAHGVQTRAVALLPGRMLMYQLGYSDAYIAREQSLTPIAILWWRQRNGLAANRAPSGHSVRAKAGAPAAATLARIKRAVGRGLPRDIADEAVSDLMLAILSGTIQLAEIEKVARKFGNRALEQFADKFKTKSLDEEIGEEGDGFRMIDLLPDESSSSWLEEMGATVW